MEKLDYRRKGTTTVVSVMLAPGHDVRLILSGVRIANDLEVPRVFGGIADYWRISGTTETQRKASGYTQADAEAIARYQGADDFEAYRRESGIWAVRRKPISIKPDYGTVEPEPLQVSANVFNSRSIPQGQAVPY